MATVYLILALFLPPALVKNSFQVSGHRKRIGLLEKELDDHKQTLSAWMAGKEKLAKATTEMSACAANPGSACASSRAGTGTILSRAGTGTTSSGAE